MTTEIQIFKVQKPVGGAPHPALIYNEDRSILGEVPMTPELTTLMKGSYKIYVKGYIDDDGMLFIDEKVNNQIW